MLDGRLFTCVRSICERVRSRGNPRRAPRRRPPAYRPRVEYLEDRACPSTLSTTLFEDNFNAENGGRGVFEYAGFAKWNVAEGNVDLIGNGFFDLYPGNGLHVDLDGSRSGARLETRDAFMLAPGVYELQFSLGNNTDLNPDETNSARVTLAGVYDEVFTRTGGRLQPLEAVTRRIVVDTTASGRLVFDQEGADSAGLILDNVRLVRLDLTPTDLTLSGSSVSENSPAGAVVGNLAAVDADAGDTHTFTLLHSAGGRFRVVGSQLQVDNGTLLDFEAAVGHTVRVRVTDAEGRSFEKDFPITVTNVNEPPVHSVPGPQSTRLNQDIVFSRLNGNPLSIADVDVGANPVRVTLAASNGTLTLSSTAGLSFVAGDGADDATVTFTGTVETVNAALDGLSFRPSEGFSGNAGVTITTNDQGFGGAGGPQSDSDTVTVLVTAAGTVDLSVTASASPGPVLVGGLLTYTFTVRNNGPFTATGVTLTDLVLDGVDFVSASASPGYSAVDGRVTFHLGSLASGASVVVTVVVSPTRQGAFANLARVRANEHDLDPSNNHEVTLALAEPAA